MLEVNLSTSVGRWVAEHPQTAEVFETLHIDYCCEGEQSVEEACWKNGLEAFLVHSRLQRAVVGISDSSVDDWTHRSLADLCDHIERTHHAFLKTELSRLTDLIAEVVGEHRDAHPELVDVQQSFIAFRNELLPLTTREEDVLFPAIRNLEKSGTLSGDRVPTLKKPIRALLFDHQDVGKALRRVRQAALDFVIPDDACSSHREMLESLHRFETDTHQHIHKENHILFPRAIALAAERATHHDPSQVTH